MHVHFEESKARGDSTIQALSWMGRVPDTSTEPDTYRAGVDNAEEGWLASGNIKGTLGITLTATHGSKRWSESPTRANFNLRGHRSAITMVEWNEPYQKLATCDFSGVIFVWIKHEGRWSIELINDRNIQVTDFAWSHSGLLALIIYRDGFVLVGSVAGQRFWSSMLNVDNAFITCGIWTPDDQKVKCGSLTFKKLIDLTVNGYHAI